MNDQHSTNKSAFTAQSTMLEVLTADPSLGMVLMRDFHLGGCSHCGFNPHDTVEDVASQNGIPADRLLAALNRQA
ncbi:MAG: disulfide oxidoreductase [Planctomycetes bacterium]|nr:disulfide oxidoreductase [Planctomycetota bacterium]MCC7396019.1 disulfide oxidoreductase [Planctomycetota bacterium]